jgi:hypothetical protein
MLRLRAYLKPVAVLWPLAAILPVQKETPGGAGLSNFGQPNGACEATIKGQFACIVGIEHRAPTADTSGILS